MNKPLKKLLYWTPRILGILFVLFLSLFALDIFDMKLGFWGMLAGLIMHLLPSILLAIAVAIAWRREWIGAVLFTGWAIIYIFISTARSLHWSAYVMIAGIPVLIGLLFLAGWIWRARIRGG